MTPPKFGGLPVQCGKRVAADGAASESSSTDDLDSESPLESDASRLPISTRAAQPFRSPMASNRTHADLFADIGLRVEDFGGDGNCGPLVGAAILWKRLPARASVTDSFVRSEVAKELRKKWEPVYSVRMTDDEKVSFARSATRRVRRKQSAALTTGPSPCNPSVPAAEWLH